jgi:hypothetical protein
MLLPATCVPAEDCRVHKFPGTLKTYRDYSRFGRGRRRSSTNSVWLSASRNQGNEFRSTRTKKNPGKSMISRGSFDCVREGGFEPPRPFGHWHLKPARLPFRHSRATSSTGNATRFADRQPRKSSEIKHNGQPRKNTNRAPEGPWGHGFRDPQQARAAPESTRPPPHGPSPTRSSHPRERVITPCQRQPAEP